MRIDRLIIDSTQCRTELCSLGRFTQSDKSPYNTERHRHPYTAVYSMLFSQFKYKPIVFCEIGIAGGFSAFMWSQYFQHPSTQLHLFDIDTSVFEACKKKVHDSRVTTSQMDVSKDTSVRSALSAMADSYDIIIDDSSHEFEHQIRIVKEALPLLKTGGMLIIEDIFRNIPEENFAKELEDVLEGCSAAYFVLCEHEYRWSPGWDNDKMLVLVKGG